MAKIDIRTTDDEEIDVIQFASSPDDSYETAVDIRHDKYCHKGMLFLHYDDNTYLTIAQRDVKNLIKALEKSLAIWPDES